MNSFTSVFKTNEACVVISVLALLAATEIFFRTAGNHLSEDVISTSDIARTAESVANAPPPRLLVLGNSLARKGIDPKLLASEMKQQAVFMAYPDSSHALVWDYLLTRHFVETGSLPDELLIITGGQHLLDSPGNDSHMGAYYVSWREVPRYLREDVATTDQAIEFLLGRTSSAFSMRSRISPRMFDAVLPYYQENWEILNRAAMAGKGTALSGAVKGGTTRHLRHLLTTLIEKGVSVKVVLAPMPSIYQLDEQVALTLGELKIPIINLNPISGIGPESFADADHLNEAGQVVFTRALAKALASTNQK